ncbi:MAG: EamA family transporter [Promethearchaeati archaeon SRVP18_Atabeyarchaeia-1]
MSDIFILLSLLSAILVGFSVAMERKGLSQLPEITPGKIARNPIRVVLSLILCKLWIVGWIIAQVGWALWVQAINIGDFNVAKTLSSLSIVVATLLCVRLLGERLNHIEKAGIILVTLGTLSVSLESQVTKPGFVDYNAFIAFNGIALGFAFSLMIASGIRKKEQGRPIWEVSSATAAGIFYSVSALFQNLASYTTPSGQAGFNLFSIQSWLAFLLNAPFIVGYLIILLGFFSIQSAMSRGRASIAYPISTSLGIAIPVLGSALIFGEMLVVPIDGTVQFPLSYLRLIGTILAIVGGALIQTHSWRMFGRRKGVGTAVTKKSGEKQPS